MSLFSYQDIGSGFPVVLAGSYLWGDELWAAQIEPLAAHYRLIIVQLPGHDNDTALPARCTAPADLAQEAARLLDGLGIDRYALAGISVGGMWAAELALLCPAQVAGLALIDTYLGAEPVPTLERYFALLDIIERTGSIGEELAAQIVPLFFRPSIAHDDPIRVRFRQRLLDWPSQRLRDAVVPLGRLIFGRPERLHALQALNPDTTRVFCGEHDIPRPLPESRQMAAVVGCPLVTVADAGHVAVLENPSFSTAQLQAWLRDITAST